MKRTGAILLSIFLAMVLTVSNMAGAYHTAARVYAAEEKTIGGGDNLEGESNEPQGQGASGGLGDDTTSLVGDTTTVPAGEGESLNNPQNPAPGQGDSQVLSTGDVATSPAPAPVTMLTVSFDANGHGTAPGTVSVVAGECVEKPADLSADGFLFTGWYRDAGATSAWDFDTDTVNGDITLYAGWTAVVTTTSQEDTASYSVGGNSFAGNDTSSTVVSNSSDEGDNASGAGSTSNTGNNSATASTSNTGSNNNSDDGMGSAQTTSENQSGDRSTTAATTFTVTFNANGHGTAPQAVTVNEGETITEPAAPTEDGYTFTGWYEDKDATDAWDFATNTVSDNTTLYAGWTENTQRALRNAPALRNGNTDTHSVTVTHNGYGSAEASPDSATKGTTITLTATPQSGYSLDYWEVLSGGVTVTNNTFEMGTEDVEVKAIFKYDPTNHFIKIDPSLQNLKFGKPVTLRLSEGGLSNGAITWTSSDPSTLSINGTEATFHKTGTVRITASQAAYGEFAAVTDSLEVTIGKGDASSIDWPTLGPVYYKMSIVDIPISGGSTEWGTFSINATAGQYENSRPGTTTGWTVVFTPKAELASYFEANISQWVTYTVQARDTLDSCISVSPNTIDFGTVEQKNLDTVSEIQVIVFNRTDLSAAEVYVDITPGDNEYFRVRNGSGGDTASPGSQIMFYIEPKTTLTPGTYEVPITFTAATSSESVEKTLTAKIVVRDNLPEASVVISPNITEFSLVEGYDPDKYAQTITLTNTGTESLEITDYTFKGGRYSFDLERISTSSTIPVGGTVEYRIKPIAGHTYPGYALRSPHSLRFILKDPNGQQSAKETTVVMRIDEYVDYFGSLTVTPDTLDFGTETAGYAMLSEQAVAFSNHNIVGIRGDRFPRSSNYILRFWQEDLQMINSDVVIAPGIRARMTVAPRQGLPAGTYDETLEIEFYNYWGEMETRTVNLKFTVEKAESTVTVTGDGHGTASANSPTAKDGTIVYLSATPNDGYLFSHWEVTSGGVTLDDAYSQMTAFKIGKDDVTVKAHFTAIPSGNRSIKVTTDGHGSASSDPKSGSTGDDVNLSAKAAEGYYFVRWEVVSGGVQIADATNPKPQRPAFKIGDSDVEIKAVFAKNPYQVTVTVEGLGTAEAAPDSGRAGDTVSLTATPREYYRFKEWRITSGSGTIADKTSATTTFTFANESAEVKAVFEAIPYGVDIDYVGKGTVEELPGTYNNEFMLTAKPADGYKFYKWEVLDHSTGVITAVGSTNKAFIEVRCDAERIKMRVTFVTIPYSISYTLNGGTNASGNPNTYTVEDTIVLAEPGRDGFTFDGWYDESGKKMTTIPAGTTGNLTLEARWKPTVYSITYNLNGGSNHPDNPTTYTVETNTITLEDASHSVLVFDGWYDASGNKVTQIVKGSKGNLTLEARWKKATAPTIIFPTASDITYGQTLADSVLTGGSMEYGTFAWEEPSRVPDAGTIPCGMTFKPSAETEQNYEPIPDANKKKDVSVIVAKATPAVTISVKKDTTGTTATLTATVQKAGQGLAPTGTVKFEYSTDNGTTWTTVPSGDAVTLAAGTDGNASATRPWDSFDENTTYILRATYGGDSNYNQADGNTIFDPRKQDQSVLQVEPSKTDPVYGDVLTFRTSGGSGDGAVAYTVSDPSVMTVDANGKVSILKSGTVVVTATKEGDTNYNAATASVSVTVKKAKLTFTAEDKTVNQGDAMPAMTFKTTGLVAGDTLSTVPTITTTATNSNAAGTYDIQITGGSVTTNGGATWTDCYEPQYVNGKLTVNAAYNVTVTNGTALVSGGTAATTIQAFPDDTVTVTADAPRTGFKFGGWNVTSGTITLSDANNTTATFTMPKENVVLEAIYVIDSKQITTMKVDWIELTSVPQSLQSKYKTLDDMKTAMLTQLNKLGFKVTNVGSEYLFYDVVLMVSFDKGQSWVKADEHNFPKEGLSVFLTDPVTKGYPAGTARNTHRFYVSHMFTTNVNGKTPGDTEEMIATNQQGGISVTLTGLSPVLVTWEKVTTPTQPTQPTTPGSGGGSGGGTPTAQPTSTGGQNAVENTNTTVVSTNASGARSASDAQNASARGGQTGDDIYERLGLHTMILLAALLLLIAQLRKLMEENALFAVAVSRAGAIRKTRDLYAPKQKTRIKRTESGLVFIELDAGTKRINPAKRCNKKNREVRKH